MARTELEMGRARAKSLLWAEVPAALRGRRVAWTLVGGCAADQETATPRKPAIRGIFVGLNRRSIRRI